MPGQILSSDPWSPRLSPSIGKFLPFEKPSPSSCQNRKTRQGCWTCLVFLFSACRKGCPLLKILCSCGTQRCAAPRLRLLLRGPKLPRAALAAVGFDRGANPCSLLPALRDMSGALPLDPASTCGAQNRLPPLSRLPVLTAVPTPARCFPYHGICRGLCPSTPPPLAGSKTTPRRSCGSRF